MAYISANLHLIPQAGNRLNARIYEGTDAYATVAGAGYISDAKDRGMNVGDTVTVKQFTTSGFTAITAVTSHVVTAVATSGATLSTSLTGGTVTLTNVTTANPTVAADTTAGYVIGSLWYNSSTGDTFQCVDATTGAAVWISDGPLKVLLQAGKVATLGSGAEVYRWRAPFKGKIVSVSAILNGALASADGSVTFAIAGTGVTNGVITLTQAASAAGTKFTATPTALNTFNAGDTITATIGGGDSSASTANLAALTVQLP